jgi:hypothetical protein
MSPFVSISRDFAVRLTTCISAKTFPLPAPFVMDPSSCATTKTRASASEIRFRFGTFVAPNWSQI